MSSSVHYTVLNRTYQGKEDPIQLLRTAPAAAEQLFTPAMLAKVHTLIPLVWRYGILTELLRVFKHII